MYIILYEFKKQPVRSFIGDNKEPWFVVKDVLEVLGLNRNNTEDIPKKSKGVRVIDTSGGRQRTSVIDEPSLYRFIIKSKKKLLLFKIGCLKKYCLPSGQFGPKANFS